MDWRVFASTLTKLHKKTSRTLLLGKNDKDDKEWKLSLNSQGSVGPMWSRSDYLEALLREEQREAAQAGHQFSPTIRPELEVRQRRRQQFQQNKHLPQIMLLQNNVLHGPLIRRQAGYGGHLLHHGRRLPSTGWKE